MHLMNPTAKLALLAAAALLLSGCAAFRAAPTLPPAVSQALEKTGLPESALAFVAIPLHQRDRGLRLLTTGRPAEVSALARVFWRDVPEFAELPA